MKHQICDACETVVHCSQHGCIPLQPQQTRPAPDKSSEMNLKQILDQTPRLRAWAAIGPVQHAEVEQFAQLLLNSQAAALTADGVLVEAGDPVWVLSSLRTPMPTTVRKLQAYTTYTLFGPVPVAHSWSTRQAANKYLKENYGN